MGVGGITYITKLEPGWVDVNRVELSLPRLDPAFAGFRMAQISDIHLSEAITGEHVAEACRLVMDWKPDLVTFTGDYVDRRHGINELLADLADAFRPLAQQVQSVAILGNHDYRMGANAIRRMLYAEGIELLENQSISLTRGKANLHIAGVDDPWWGRPRLRDVLEKLPDAGAAVLLAHEPDYADVSSIAGRFDLQISGHTHGGQVVLPVVGPPLLPYLGRKYYSGLYKVGDMLQYTNRGLGMTEPHIRFNCRPEVTLYTFQPKE